jgi:hypothetical protein
MQDSVMVKRRAFEDKMRNFVEDMILNKRCDMKGKKPSKVDDGDSKD